MRCIYKTDNGVLSKLKDFEPDVWVNLITPDMDEIVSTAKQYGIDVNDMKAALDDEESSRVQLEDGYTLILVDIPSAEVRNNQNAYTTIPLGILLVRNAIITVCGTETPVLTYFSQNLVRGFSTKKKMRFVYQILLRTTNMYQAFLRVIDKRRSEIEQRVSEENDTEDRDLIHLHAVSYTHLVFIMIFILEKVQMSRSWQAVESTTAAWTHRFMQGYIPSIWKRVRMSVILSVTTEKVTVLAKIS